MEKDKTNSPQYSEADILTRTADSITDKPDEITVDKRPTNKWLQKFMDWGLIPKKRKYIIRQLRYTNVLRISRELVKIPEAAVLLGSEHTQRQVMELMANHGETLARVAAIVLTDAREEPTPEFIARIITEFSKAEITAICMIAVKRADPEGFIHSIILIAGLDVLRQKTAEEMSQAVTREIIARGVSSDQQPDISKGGL